MTKLSPSAAKRVIIGRLGATHGVKGTIRVTPLTDFPERFAALKQVQAGDELLTVTSAHPGNKGWLLTFAGYETRERAQELTGRLLTVSREEAAPLSEGEFYTFDIIGLAVRNESGDGLGEITNVLKTGSNDVYVMKRPDGGETLIPALKAVVREINVAAGFMTVKLPEEFV